MYPYVIINNILVQNCKNIETNEVTAILNNCYIKFRKSIIFVIWNSFFLSWFMFLYQLLLSNFLFNSLTYFIHLFVLNIM